MLRAGRTLQSGPSDDDGDGDGDQQPLPAGSVLLPPLHVVVPVDGRERAPSREFWAPVLELVCACVCVCLPAARPAWRARARARAPAPAPAPARARALARVQEVEPRAWERAERTARAIRQATGAGLGRRLPIAINNRRHGGRLRSGKRSRLGRRRESERERQRAEGGGAERQWEC